MASNDTDAPHSILTTRQREMLDADDPEGELGINDQNRWRKYSDIRSRIEQAIYDLALIFDNWDELNVGRIFEEPDRGRWEFEKGAEAAMYTFYRGFFGGYTSFGQLLQNAVNRAEIEMNNRPVRVTFSVKEQTDMSVALPHAADRVNPKEVEDLRVEEMRELLRALAHSDADVSALAQEGATARVHEQMGRDRSDGEE